MSNLEIATAAAEAAFLAADKAQAIAEATKLVQDETLLSFLAQAAQDMADEAANHWEAVSHLEEDQEEVSYQVSLAFDAVNYAQGAACFVEDLAAQFAG